MSNQLVYGSLFSGIGGIDLGFDRAGLKCAWQVEIDPDALEVLDKHWPWVPKYGDIRTFEPTPVDVICGGFPCQGISVAGKGGGLSDDRSGLWTEYFRVVKRVKPRIVVIENSPAIRTRGLREIVEQLASIGYVCEWDVIPAAAFGAPHLRERMFIIADTLCSTAPVENGCCEKRWFKTGTLEPAVLPPVNGASRTKRFEASALFDRWISVLGSDEPVERVSAVADGVSERLVGNAVVPQVAEWIGRRLIDVMNKVLSDRLAANE
jgi:DNA (cytosine-5)-methyltransferase 1